MRSEITEKQRSVIQVETLVGVSSLLSRISIVTRARCILDKSRSILLARWADSISGGLMMRLSTLVRTFVFCPMRMLSADIFHKRASSCSVCSMRMGFPAHGKRITGRLAVSSVIVVLPYHYEHLCSLIYLDERHCSFAQSTGKMPCALLHCTTVGATCGHRAR